MKLNGQNAPRWRVFCGALLALASCEALNFSNPGSAPDDPDTSNTPQQPEVTVDPKANVFITYLETPDAPFTSVSVRYISGGKVTSATLDIQANAFVIPDKDHDKTVCNFTFMPGGPQVLMGRSAGDTIRLHFSKSKKLIFRNLDQDASPVPGRPVRIGSYAELLLLRECLGNPQFNDPAVSFLQEGHIDLFGKEMYKVLNLYRPWVPLGYQAEGPVPFAAVYDGNGKQLLNMAIDNGQDGQGFFARVEGVVKDLDLRDGYMETGNESGLICAVNAGTIENCAASGAVKKALTGSSGASLGGICGVNEAGAKIIACYFIGSVDAVNDSGGVCGTNRGRIEACYHYGSVQGDNVHHIAGVGAGSISSSFWTGGLPADTQAVAFSGVSWPVLTNNDAAAGWAEYMVYGTDTVKKGRWKEVGTPSDDPPRASLPKLWFE